MGEINQEIKYDAHGRMQYHPDFHTRHKEPWTTSEQKFLIENYTIMGPEAVALALGRAIGVVMTRAYNLRKRGLMPKRKDGDKRFRRTRAENAEK